MDRQLSTGEVAIKTVWRRPDSAVREDAKSLWKRLDILPAGVDPDVRADELCIVAYVGGQIAGVCTAVIEKFEFLRQRIAMLRVLVAPEIRSRGIQGHLCRAAFAELSRWSLENPAEAVMGMGLIVQNEMLAARKSPAVYRDTGLALVGYTARGERFMVAWFDHARV